MNTPRVIRRTPLLYRRGADPELDRPAHVRAGSALAFFGGKLAVVQDDANFLALIDPETGQVDDLPFPGAVPRQFDDTRGNKENKLDLEAVFVASGMLIALGSGSSRRRERVVLVYPSPSPISIVEAPELYAMLRDEAAFSGCELNVEGAAVLGDDVVLFQRGNGAPNDRAVDATARIALAPLLAYLQGEGPCPPLRDVLAWDLGRVDGRRLTFTDGAAHDGKLTFLACAEDSPDATHDGPVTAVALGHLDGERHALALILDEHGAPLLDKAEGLAWHPSEPAIAYVVTDRDDPALPSELLTLRLATD
jgi:hypothetical protein